MRKLGALDSNAYIEIMNVLNTILYADSTQMDDEDFRKSVKYLCEQKINELKNKYPNFAKLCSDK